MTPLRWCLGGLFNNVPPTLRGLLVAGASFWGTAMSKLGFMPPREGPAQRFYCHQLICTTCKTFDGSVDGLATLCFSGTRLLKDDWVELEHVRKIDRARRLDESAA